MIHSKIPVLALVLSTGLSTAIADVENGKELHDESCVDCHMVSEHSALYTRQDKKVDSLHRLGGQVSACTQILNISWFPDEEKDVVEYLNAEYYKFTKE